MARTWFSAACLLLLAASFVIASPREASAQTTINQISCTSGCATPFLQDLTVTCPASINSVLATIADRNGPNRITIAGSCTLSTNIVGFNRLTIEGTGGATLNRGINIANSSGITLRNLTVDLAGAFGQNVSISSSNVFLDGVTVKNAQFNYGITLGSGSQLSFGPTAPSLVADHGCSGIRVGAGSLANLANVTISGNGQAGCGHLGKQGIVSEKGGAIHLINYVTLANGSRQDAAVNITGNYENGILMEGGWISTDAESGNGLIHVYNNGGLGAELNGASGEIVGRLKFDGNAPNGNDFFQFPVQVGVGLGGWIAMGGGVEIQGGMAALGNTTLVVGNGGPMTITGGLTLVLGATGFDAGENTIDAATCDPLSYLLRFDDSSTIGTNTCPSEGPSGIKGDKGDTGEPGPQGEQGIQGPPGGISGREIVTNAATQSLAKAVEVSVPAACPAGKVVLGGGASTTNPNLVVISSLPTSATQWTAVFRNTANNSQTGTLTTTAVCSVAQ